MKRFGLLYVAPTVVLLAAVVLPLILGTGTLFRRDVLNSHYPMKWAQGELLRQGELSLIDPYRAGGQAMVGNLNAAPLYPTSLLFAVAPRLWALNAHFWIHLLLAPFAVFWLGRAWGLGRPAAWAAGAVYAASGYFFSQLNLYNLVAGTALAPALVAAGIEAWGGTRRRAGVLFGLLWALMVLAGDPLLALLALALALGGGWLRHRRRPAAPWRLLAAFACGSLLLAPQVVETLRILPLSFRGHWRLSAGAALSQSWDPRAAAEWLLPLVFGHPGFGYWGFRFHGGNPPLFFSLAPGLLALVLLATSGRPREGVRIWSWAAIGGGLFLALGAYNPAMVLLHRLPGASLLRYPVKAWLLVAVGGAILAGVGFERLLGGGERRLERLLWGAAGLYAALLLPLLAGPQSLHDALRGLGTERFDAALYADERGRWTVIAGLVLLTALLLLAGLRLRRRRPALGSALLLTVHVASQIVLLKPLAESDEAAYYRRPPPLLAAVPEDARVVHGATRGMFGAVRGVPAELFPDRSDRWPVRAQAAELHAFSGIQWGRRYELAHSPEGLDSFFTVSLVQAMMQLDDRARLRILEASGVDTLIMDRALDDPESRAVLRATAPGAGHDVRLYGLPRAAPPVALVGRTWRAADMGKGLARLIQPGFDPRREVVLPGPGTSLAGAGGEATVLLDRPEELVVETAAKDAAVLVIQRTFLPIYRASVDGTPAAARLANVHRIAVEVPAGRHQVRLWVDRRPFHAACGAALLGALGLLFLARVPGRRER